MPECLDKCFHFVHVSNMDDPAEILPSLAGQRLQRGVCRALLQFNVTPMLEVVLAGGLRADVMAIGPKGEIWIVECKSSREDFLSDRKWQGYLPYCDRFFWGVDVDFPREILPEGQGLILADAWGGEMLAMGELTPLAGARRKALTQAFARTAAFRLQKFQDPRL